jgi:H2-forming N5,N10-methylenetetrahydromethanopterin dehydrogenase-like enzyme
MTAGALHRVTPLGSLDAPLRTPALATGCSPHHPGQMPGQNSIGQFMSASGSLGVFMATVRLVYRIRQTFESRLS